MIEWTVATRPYPYPFGEGEHGLPESRRALAGTSDLGTAEWARRGRKLNMRRALDTLARNAHLDGRRSWPLLDSFGREIALIERHADHWELSDPASGETVFVDHRLDPRQLEVQGRGCMIDDELERSHALIAFRALDRGGLVGGASIVPFRLRAFVNRAALPLRNSEGRPIRRAIDRYDTGSGGSTITAGAPDLLRDPGFSSDEGFLGEDGKQRSYATYNAKPPFRGAMYFSVNTTGVHGGGIARGVARAGDQFELLDRFGYGDPNVAAGEPIATWVYGRLVGTRMFGWVPARLT
jgi:hypothetical protein